MSLGGGPYEKAMLLYFTFSQPQFLFIILDADHNVIGVLKLSGSVQVFMKKLRYENKLNGYIWFYTFFILLHIE